MQKANLNQSEFIDFLGHPEVIDSFKTILGEIETVIDVLQREKIDFELLLKVNDGLLQDFRLAVSQYPEMQLFYEQNWNNLHSLETIPSVVFDANPEYIESNREKLIEQFKQAHQCIQSPIIATENNEQENIQINYVPQGICNDLAQGDDQLSIEDELRAIADVLLLRQLEPPIAVGILGTWGSGKSFAMHLIQKRVNEIRCEPRQQSEAWGEGLEADDPDKEKKLSPYVGHIYQIKFNAWSYAKSDLWASLMEEIFSELNQQLTLENQLQKIGIDPLTGGKIWEALEKLSEGDQQYLKEYLTEEQAQQLVEMQASIQLEDTLLNTLTETKQKSVRIFEAKQAQLNQIKKQLEHKKKQILMEQDSITNVFLGATEELIEARIGFPLFKRIKIELEIIREQLQHLENQDPNTILETTNNTTEDLPKIPHEFHSILRNGMDKVMEQNAQRISWGLFYQWCKKNHILLLTFGVVTIILLGIVFIFFNSKNLNFFTQGFALLTTFFGGQRLFDSFAQWKEDAQLALAESTQHLEERIQNLIEQDPAIQKDLKEIQNLELELEEQSRKLPKSSYSSLADFLGDRLKPENYSNHLGLMHQVQRDLQHLSDQLLPSQENREQIKTLFPRGEPRVFLYIDDLDRCPPDRVVEVLEAVQLLLNTPLFVVILAVDDRYIARALEQVYTGVLKRRGRPSGIDYLEKIIQIPYRMRPISPETINKYLQSQIQVISAITEPNFAENSTTEQTAEIVPFRSAEQASITPQQSIEAIRSTDQTQSLMTQQTTTVSLPNVVLEAPAVSTNLHEINTIEQTELDLIVDCCQYVDITPRTGKRLINIYKILKIVWQNRQEPNRDTKKILFSLLALSGRYPDFMRNLFEEMDTEFQEELETNDHLFDYGFMLAKLYPQIPKTDYQAQREWRKFKSDLNRMLPLNPFHLTKADFYLILSFCFVGDIGYDPDDFAERLATQIQ